MLDTTQRHWSPPRALAFASFEAAVFVLLVLWIKFGGVVVGEPRPIIVAGVFTHHFLTPLTITAYFARGYYLSDTRSLLDVKLTLVLIVSTVLVQGSNWAYVALTCSGEECMGVVLIPLLSGVYMTVAAPLAVLMALLTRGLHRRMKITMLLSSVPKSVSIGILAVLASFALLFLLDTLR